MKSKLNDGKKPILPLGLILRRYVLPRIPFAADPGLAAAGSGRQRRAARRLPLLRSLEPARVLPRFSAAGLLLPTAGPPPADDPHPHAIQLRRRRRSAGGGSVAMVGAAPGAG